MKNGIVYFYALKDIQPGDELLISYVSRLAPTVESHQRTGILKDLFLFDCSCHACSTGNNVGYGYMWCSQACSGWYYPAYLDGNEDEKFICNGCGNTR